jgi:hypothetical protein
MIDWLLAFNAYYFETSTLKVIKVSLLIKTAILYYIKSSIFHALHHCSLEIEKL